MTRSRPRLHHGAAGAPSSNGALHVGAQVAQGRYRSHLRSPGGGSAGAGERGGDFNDWRPGVHRLQPRNDGKRAVTVALPAETTQSFRYLAAGDYWFNDESAEDRDGANNRLHT
ncbi:hypothetical protein ACIQU4_18120 [Streptomyces sp. NPDC090741]|uniref:hypothetical protein n=1 Tax=Streptomyces sp. NPDC090741 TaxID=3365967 RepID=UPI00382A27C8